jgi:NAD(P)-dependent dehydrogenase (short-subunit alcohol dehydrogenase family)
MQAFLPLLKQSEAGRIVNVSTELASLAQNTNPHFEFYQIKLLAYNSSKTTLNAVTMQFAHELKDTPIKVNAADPGYTATDLRAQEGGSATKSSPATEASKSSSRIRLVTRLSYSNPSE